MKMLMVVVTLAVGTRCGGAKPPTKAEPATTKTEPATTKRRTCTTHADCAAGEVCDECATSSCDTCDDCVAACTARKP